MTFGNKVRKIAIRKGEVRNIVDPEKELKDQIEQSKMLQEKNEDFKFETEGLQGKIDQLWKDLHKAREIQSKAEEKVEELYADLEKFKEENAHLFQFIQKLEELKKLENSGNKFTEVHERQQQRKLRELKTKAERALWFPETFGLKLTSVEFQDDTGKTHSITYQGQGQGTKPFQEVSKEDQDKI